MLKLYALTAGVLATAEGGDSVVNIDFTPMLQTALNLITSDFAKYAMVAGASALAVWGAPKAIVMVKKFFNAMSR